MLFVALRNFLRSLWRRRSGIELRSRVALELPPSARDEAVRAWS